MSGHREGRTRRSTLRYVPADRRGTVGGSSAAQHTYMQVGAEVVHPAQQRDVRAMAQSSQGLGTGGSGSMLVSMMDIDVATCCRELVALGKLWPGSSCTRR